VATDSVGRSTKREAGRTWPLTASLLSPPALWLTLFFLLPIVIVALYSVGKLQLFPTDSAVFSLDGWRALLGGGSVYLGLFWKSMRVALTVAVVVVALSYPIGYFLALTAGKRRYVLLLLIITPFLTSFLLRVLAWKVILGHSGVVSSALVWLNLRSPDQPISWLIYSQFSVMLVLVYIWVPFVALPIFVTLENLDRSFLEAASDLGASRWRTFLRVTLPLSFPGLVAAFVFVFIPTIGEFVTPLLVGGSSGFLYGNAIRDMFESSLDWQTGSVLSLFLLAVVAVLTALFARFLRPDAVVRD
jgi:spermidine/putrescine transport system permease protein